MAKRNGNIPSIRAGVVAPQGFSSLKATITLISNQEEVICTSGELWNELHRGATAL